MKRNEDEKRGWILIAVFLLIGLLCLILAGNLAIRFASSWSLESDMRSRLDPDSLYSTLAPDYVFQPVDPAILTPPVWIDIFLTPGQTIPTRTPRPTEAPTEFIPPTQIPPTIPPTILPTNTIVYWPVPATQTSFPVYTKTSKPPVDIDTPTASSIPATPTSINTPILTPSSIPTLSADLQVTITDGLFFYPAGRTLTYTVVASNNGPDPAAGTQISAAFSPQQLASWSWACARQDNGASGCDSAGNSNVNFGDIVDLPPGASITYTVTAAIRANPSGSLSTTVSIREPVTVLDPVQGNNSATDTNELANTLPYTGIGSAPDGVTYLLHSGASITFAFDTPLVVNGHSSWDLVFYELPIGSGIGMDWTILQIGDGVNWYTVFYWGDGNADTNSNLDISTIGGSEDDNRDFSTPPASDILYSSGGFNTGIVMDVDGAGVPNGTYPYFRFIAPSGDLDGGTEIDAITILP
jgi:hypothetical protein